MTFWSSGVQTDATINASSGTTKLTASPPPTTTWSTRRRTQLLEQRLPAASQAKRTLSPSGRSMPWIPAPLWRHATTAMAWPALSSSMSGDPSHSSPSPLRLTPRLSRRVQRLGCRWSLSPDDDADPFLVLGWLGSCIARLRSECNNSEHLPGSTLVTCGTVDSTSLPFCKCHPEC